MGRLYVGSSAVEIYGTSMDTRVGFSLMDAVLATAEGCTVRLDLEHK